MSSYPKRVAENILPLSISGELSEAFKEWSFTEITEDHEDVIENCQLCNQEQLRYHFEIKNEYTNERLMVGSSCILKFNVAVYEKDIRLNEKDSKNKLDQFLKKMRLESCIKALEKLAISENNKILKSALIYYSENRLQKNNIDHSPSFFKISSLFLESIKFKSKKVSCRIWTY